MKAIIKTNDKKLFYALIRFLRVLHFDVEIIKEKKHRVKPRTF